MFRDDYTNFVFDDLQSENFKVWITNKHDLQRNMSPNFSDKYNSPTYSQLRYHEGTTIDKQDFKLSCVAVDVTLNEWRAICEWLSPLRVGKLRFDWNDKYYYMVKISKAPSGTMFIKNRVDSVLGQLYIVEFSLEFTTVYDWAALGEYQEIDMENTEIGENYNNPYFIPMVLKRETEVGFKHIINSNSNHATGSDIVTFRVKKGESIQANIYVLDIEHSKTISKASIKRDSIADFCTYTYYGTDINYKLNIDTKTDEVYDYVSFFSNPNELIAASVNNMDIKKERFGNVIINNPASYNCYPDFFINKKFCNISDSNKSYYNFSMNGENEELVPVTINSKAMTMTANGQIINLVQNDKGQPLFSDIQSNNQLVVSSGRPEMLKCYIVSNENCPSTSEDGEATYNFRKLVFRTNKKITYDRPGPCILNIFTPSFVDQYKNTNVYNMTPYGYDNNYINKLNTVNHVIIYEPQLLSKKIDQDLYEITLCYFTTNDTYLYPDEKIDTSNFSINQIVYLSLSDSSLLNITNIDKDSMDDPSKEYVRIGIQTREVI